ncbi:MAG: 4-(cytidine 5'-diphospho)-2-C-methyl-D-erythritol kinase [Caulobacteraceae bacterium]
MSFAPAKINLFLHVGPLAADGYHPISSLMTFADVGDELVSIPAAKPEFEIAGPFACGLESGPDNLVIRARDALMAALGSKAPSLRLVLTKNLPIASGIGGGSADAAAALHLICQAAGVASDGEVVAAIARSLGADVLACLSGEPALARGRGDELGPAPAFPSLHAVLVNPLVASPTAEVYRAYDASPTMKEENQPEFPSVMRSAGEAAAWLAGCRNDLQAPAIALRPRIGEALAALAGEPETLLARMSGTGATSFALCRDQADATALERKLAERNPLWWVRRTVLAGSSGR